jgi:hypothetical protein
MGREPDRGRSEERTASTRLRGYGWVPARASLRSGRCRLPVPLPRHPPPPARLVGYLPQLFISPGLCGPLLSLQSNPLSISLSQPPPSSLSTPQSPLPLRGRRRIVVGACPSPEERGVGRVEKGARACFPQAFLNCELVGGGGMSDGMLGSSQLAILFPHAPAVN